MTFSRVAWSQIKWAALAAAIAVTAATVVSGFGFLGYNGKSCTLLVWRGRILASRLRFGGPDGWDVGLRPFRILPAAAVFKAPTGSIVTLILPFWPVAILCAGGAGLAWRRERAARRRVPGACTHCGYDRRGLARPAAACPECGTGPEPNGRLVVAQGASPGSCTGEE